MCSSEELILNDRPPSKKRSRGNSEYSLNTILAGRKEYFGESESGMIANPG